LSSLVWLEKFVLKNKIVLKIDSSKRQWDNFSGRFRVCPALCKWSRALPILSEMFPGQSGKRTTQRWVGGGGVREE